MTKKNKKTTELIISYGTEMIENRFRVKVSRMDDGVHPESFLVVAEDLLDSGFCMKFFKNKEDITQFLKLLQLATK